MEHEGGQLAPFVFHAVNLVILVGLFVYFYTKKGRGAVADAIAKGEAELLQAQEELGKAKQELEAQRREHAALGARITDLKAANRDSAEREAARILDAGKITADYLVTEARQHAEYLSQLAVDEVFREVAGTLVDRSRKQIGRSMTPDAQSRLDAYFLRKLPSQAGQPWTL